MLTKGFFTFARDGSLGAWLLVREILFEAEVARALKHPEMTAKITIRRADECL